MEDIKLQETDANSEILQIKEVIQKYNKYYSEIKKQIREELKKLPHKGNVKKRKISGHYYYYWQFREKDKIKHKYIGKEEPNDLIKQVKRRQILKKKLQSIDDNLW